MGARERPHLFRHFISLNKKFFTKFVAKRILPRIKDRNEK
jgi:hypothetical protein